MNHTVMVGHLLFVPEGRQLCAVDAICREVIDCLLADGLNHLVDLMQSYACLEWGMRMLADEQDKLLSNRRRLAVELRRLRERAGLSGRQLAERIGISQSKV